MNLAMLFVASSEAGVSLMAFAERAFSSPGLKVWEERFSDNYPNGHYFAGYAENGQVNIYDGDVDRTPNYPFRLLVDDFTWRKGSGTIMTNPPDIAKLLASNGFTVFVPNEDWYMANWDGEGDVYTAQSGAPRDD